MWQIVSNYDDWFAWEKEPLINISIGSYVYLQGVPLEFSSMITSSHNDEILSIILKIRVGIRKSDKEILTIENIGSLRVYLSVCVQDIGVKAVEMRRFVRR